MSFPRPGGGPLVASEDEEFVRQNSVRFESIWREATPLSLDARELAGFGREVAPNPGRATTNETTRRPAAAHESSYRAALPDPSELALGRMFRA